MKKSNTRSHVLLSVEKKNKTEEVFQLFSQTSTILSRSFDYKKTLNKFCNLAVRSITYYCSVYIISGTGEINLLTQAHLDKKIHLGLTKQVNKKNVQRIFQKEIAQVVLSEKSKLFPIFFDTNKSINSTYTKKLLGYSLLSVMIVPIEINKKVSGVIVFAVPKTKHTYTSTDVNIAEQLSNRIGLALQNTQLYTQIQQQKERLQSIVKHVPALLWESWTKKDVTVLKEDFVSNYVSSMLGYSKSEWLSDTNFWLNIIYEEDKKYVFDEVTKIFKKGGRGTCRFRWITKSGKFLWVETQISIIKNAKGIPVGIRGIAMDITERVELENRKDEFISMASHELKTPVTSLKVFVQMLQKLEKKKESEDYLVYLKKMDMVINKLNKLIVDLLDVSKVQLNKLEIREEIVDIDTVVLETVQAMQSITKTHQIILQGRTNKKIYADPDRIEQVLLNLMTNAIKYSPNADKIIVYLKTVGKYIEISVKDFGIGIEKKYQQKIFERFYRITPPKNLAFPGLGIGLYIASIIAKEHKGNLWVRSVKDKGSTFFFTIPFFISKKRQIQVNSSPNTL